MLLFNRMLAKSRAALAFWHCMSLEPVSTGWPKAMRLLAMPCFFRPVNCKADSTRVQAITKMAS